MQPQQPPHATPMQGQMPPTANVSTEVIQKYLEENRQLIMAIMDNQNLGKLSECAEYQTRLQNNLLYLAAIADAQPQTPLPTPPRPQMAPAQTMTPPQGIQYMQQQQQQQQFNLQQFQGQPRQQHQLNHPQMHHLPYLPMQGHMGMHSDGSSMPPPTSNPHTQGNNPSVSKS